MATRFKCTDQLGSIAYIHQSREIWVCTLANGIPAAFFYALGHVKDEMEIRFGLDDAANDEERLIFLQNRAGPNIKVELV